MSGGPLLRYRVMAYVVGIGLVLLVVVGMPLKYIWDIDVVVAVVGPVHGFAYMVYLLAVLDLVRTHRFTVLRFLVMIGAGLVPFAAFLVEQRVTRWAARPDGAGQDSSTKLGVPPEMGDARR